MANRRWHGDKSNYDLGSRDSFAEVTATARKRTKLNLESQRSLHGLTQGQVSKRLSGGGTTHEGYSMHISVTCRSCKTVFLAARASARFCGINVSASERLTSLRDDSDALGDSE